MSRMANPCFVLGTSGAPSNSQAVSIASHCGEAVEPTNPHRGARDTPLRTQLDIVPVADMPGSVSLTIAFKCSGNKSTLPQMEGLMERLHFLAFAERSGAIVA